VRRIGGIGPVSIEPGPLRFAANFVRSLRHSRALILRLIDRSHLERHRFSG
jgi:hypothetical protein